MEAAVDVSHIYGGVKVMDIRDLGFESGRGSLEKEACHQVKQDRYYTLSADHPPHAS